MTDVYSSVVPAAPFVIGAYGLIWVTLVVFVGLTFRRISRLEKELDVVEGSMKKRQE